MKLFAWEVYESVLAALGREKLDMVVLGGHAVNFYAKRYLPVCPALERFGPFLSKDIDLLGTLADGKRLAAALKVHWKQHGKNSNFRSLTIGSFSLLGTKGAGVEILCRTRGANAVHVRSGALRIETPVGGSFQIIHPIFLYRLKGLNSVHLRQKGIAPGGRQDSKHFAIMELIVSTILRELAENSHPLAAHALVKACERLIDFWLDVDGSALVAGEAAHPTLTVPVATMSAHADPEVSHFVQNGWPCFLHQSLPAAISQADTLAIKKVRSDVRGLEFLLERNQEKGVNEE